MLPDVIYTVLTNINKTNYNIMIPQWDIYTKWNILFDRIKSIKFCNELFERFYSKKPQNLERIHSELFKLYTYIYLKLSFFVTRE